MQRPIEKFGWKKWSKEEVYTKDESIIIFEKDKIIMDTASKFDLQFEELQAIYETALEIKRETEMEEKILCNRCENTCYYGFIKCDNFKERKKENGYK